EAFAAQAVACIRLLGFDEEKVNVNGGGIALGHPPGCSGARLVGTPLHEMNRRQGEVGLAALCIGVGPGVLFVLPLVGDSSSSAVRSFSAAISLQRRLAEATTSPSSTVGAAIPISTRT